MKIGMVYVFIFLSVFDVLESSVLSRSSYNCGHLVLKNGKVRKRQRGRFLKFVCNTGYILAGEKFSTCAYGNWDPSPPRCVRPTCLNKPNPPSNGLIYPTHSGAALHIYCKANFQIRGPTDIYCDGRKWDNNMPVCLEANTKPRLFCDFEEEDICGWSHDLNHDFDWRRENYNTPSGSIGTGPSFDHTKGPGQDGYYMYIESSSRNENDTARLVSPIFDKTDTETCLEFFYHMYGATTGTLRVYLKKTVEDWNLDHTDAIFSKSGNQGNKWYRAYLPLGIVEDEYQIIIEGIRGPGYVSDIAIDDVRIIENCVYEEITTTTEVFYSTELLLTVESCENRCGHKANVNETLQISCDCDENCYDSRRCCPDYFDFCLAGTTSEEYLTTTELPDEATASTVEASQAPPVVSQSTPRTTGITATTDIPVITTNKTTEIPVSTSSKRPTTKATAESKTTKIITYATRPRIRFLPQPTKPVFIKKFLPSNIPKPNKNNIPEVIYVKPSKSKKVDTSNKEADNNDVMEVPRPKNNDEELLLTSPLPDIKMNINGDWPPRQFPDSPFLGNFSEKDKFLSVKATESVSYNVVLVTISVLGIAILTTVIVVILVRRYRLRRRRMASSNGDSQSDVRFLTSDEVLDFSLHKDYDSL